MCQLQIDISNVSSTARNNLIHIQASRHPHRSLRPSLIACGSLFLARREKENAQSTDSTIDINLGSTQIKRRVPAKEWLVLNPRNKNAFHRLLGR